ncbi:MAG: spore coat protein U domain-containing protein [Betaproteobacteria bacterium]|nr:spore coat protein U domain-containing protein [Betaproteobacteria bacterium]
MNTRMVLLSTLPLFLANTAESACSVDPTPVAFGVYSPFSGAPADTAGTLRVTCSTATVGYTVLLSAGGAGSYSPRRLSGGGHTLSYNLYTDPLRTVVWGDGSGGTASVTGAFALPGNIDHTVYGRVPALQNVSAGTYTDTITVTINF